MSRVDRPMGPVKFRSTPTDKNTAVLLKEMKLDNVAKLLGVPLQALLDANPQLKNATSVKEGQELRLPQSVKSNEHSPASELAHPEVPQDANPISETPQFRDQIQKGIFEWQIKQKLAHPVILANGSTPTAAPAAPSAVDNAVVQLTNSSPSAEAAAQLWGSLSASDQKQLVGRLVEKHPSAATELAAQLTQADPKTADEFWKHTEAWMTETVADPGYHSRLPQARAFMGEVAMLVGPGGQALKSRAKRMAGDVQFSKEFETLANRAMRNSVTEGSRARAQLHLDAWDKEMRSGAKPSLTAMARHDPEAFVRTLDGLRHDKKVYDAAFKDSLNQGSVDFTGRGERGGRTTDTYMEDLLAAVEKHGSPTLKADYAMRSHEGGSLRPGYDDVKGMRRDLLANPEVLSILLNERTTGFLSNLRDMIKNDPARAQKIIGAGVSGFTLAYSEAMSKNPPNTAAADQAAYDLGLLLGETKEAVKDVFKANPGGEVNFLEAVFKGVSGHLIDAIPGGKTAAKLTKKIAEQIAEEFIEAGTNFKKDDSKNLDKTLEKFVDQMFGAARNAFWHLRDPKELKETVRQSPELDRIKDELKRFNQQLGAGYVLGQDTNSNTARTE